MEPASSRQYHIFGTEAHQPHYVIWSSQDKSSQVKQFDFYSGLDHSQN